MAQQVTKIRSNATVVTGTFLKKELTGNNPLLLNNFAIKTIFLPSKLI